LLSLVAVPVETAPSDRKLRLAPVGYLRNAGDESRVETWIAELAAQNPNEPASMTSQRNTHE
jgi:hypothetical protein